MRLDDEPRDDIGDLKLDDDSPAPGEPHFGAARDRSQPNWPMIWVVVLLLAAILGVYFGFFRGRQKAKTPAAPPVATAPAPAATEPSATPAAAPAIELPALDASDAVVRELVGQLAEHPKLATWLASDELVRRFVVAVDNVAEGKSPRGHLGFLDPGDDFESVYKNGLAVVDPESYARYNAPAKLFAVLDAAEVAKLYRTLEPLIDDAYRDLGYPDRDFDATLAAAIDELLATPIPESDVALLPKVSSFEFADPSLEKLSPAQKHLLRMGPQNARRIQRKLAEIKDELGL